MIPSLMQDTLLNKKVFGIAAVKAMLLNCILATTLAACASVQTIETEIPDNQPTSGFNTENAPSSLAQIRERGLLIVGTATTEPFVFYDSETEKLIGFDIDLTRYIAEQMGVGVKFIEMPFANLLPALEDGKVDMTIAAMYITAEREALVDFSKPYLDTGLIMVASPELASKIKVTQDLSGLKVGVKIGATGAKLAEEMLAQGIEIVIVEYKNTFDSLLNLEVGRVDVVFNDYLNTLAYIKSSQSDLKIVTNNDGDVYFLSEAGLGIAVQQGNQELLDTINTYLMKSKREGTFDKQYEYWLLRTNQ